ncbi:hypothetical protein BDD12DRAFT_810354 [Trichophaea hybrida]|nr:hypothetical protein BDD12DRAFT_810354 [Trichophaea hybrida]
MAKDTVKIVHSVAPAEQLFHHEQQLKKGIQTILTQPLQTMVLKSMRKKGRTYAITKTETDLVIHHIWDLGFNSVGDKRKMEKLFLECSLEPGAIVRRDKITTKVTTIYRTHRETNDMCENYEQDVPAFAIRLSGHLDTFKNSTHAWDALAEHGLYPEDDREGVE